jgi:hypothetical protein
MEQSMYGVSVSTLRKYRFNVEEARARKGLRPLQPPGGRH